MDSIHDHAVAIFNMSTRTQFLRFGDATSAVLSEQVTLGSPWKILAIEDNMWDLIISYIAPNRQCFLRRSESYLFRKHRRSGVAESQKLSPGANVKDYHAQNDRTGPFTKHNIRTKFIKCSDEYDITLRYKKVRVKNSFCLIANAKSPKHFCLTNPNDSPKKN